MMQNLNSPLTHTHIYTIYTYRVIEISRYKNNKDIKITMKTNTIFPLLKIVTWNFNQSVSGSRYLSNKSCNRIIDIIDSKI